MYTYLIVRRQKGLSKINNLYKGVLFDLDGVICDTAKYHYLAWKRLAVHLGGDIDEEFNETLKGVSRKDSLQRILEKNNLELSPEKFTEMLDLKNEWYLEMLEDLDESEILEGILDIIRKLKKSGVKLVIASASKNAPYILEKIGLSDYFDAIANPFDVKHNKPAPDIFLRAAELVKLDYNDCIGIEDSQAGIDALKAAKIRSIGIGQSLIGANILLQKTADLQIEHFKVKT